MGGGGRMGTGATVMKVNEYLLCSVGMCLLTATELVAAVATVVDIVALEALGYAMAAGALEFIVATGRTAGLGIAGLLIGIVTAIVFAVAAPGALHALRVAAQELVRLASASLAAAVLIRAIRAVGHTIAYIRLLNALTVHAGRLVLAAGCLRAIVFDSVNCGREQRQENVITRHFQILHINPLTNKVARRHWA